MRFSSPPGKIKFFLLKSPQKEMEMRDFFLLLSDIVIRTDLASKQQKKASEQIKHSPDLSETKNLQIRTNKYKSNLINETREIERKNNK